MQSHFDASRRSQVRNIFTNVFFFVVGESDFKKFFLSDMITTISTTYIDISRIQQGVQKTSTSMRKYL